MFSLLSGIPSAPRDLSYEIIGSNVLLTWRLPKDLGGRKDVFFNVICKVCPPGSPGPCVRCGDSVQFEPRQVGLTESRVQVSNLLARVQYTFEIQAVNLVTELSSEAPQYATINVSTSQSGEEACLSVCHPSCFFSLFLSLLCLYSFFPVLCLIVGFTVTLLLWRLLLSFVACLSQVVHVHHFLLLFLAWALLP